MNKKRLAKVIALSSVLSLSAVTAISLIGCDDDEAKHTHTLSEVQAIGATCTEDGNVAYWTCGGCDLLFADANGSKTITLAETAVGKLGHDLSGEDKHHAEDPATCTKPGTVEYWQCGRCDLKFSDAQGNNAISNIVTTKEHDWGTNGHHEMIFPTTTTEGKQEYWQCKDCTGIFADKYGDKTTTLAELKIDTVKENIDGVRTDEFYNTDNALAVGGADVGEGGEGFIINAKREDDGVYMHIVANYNVAAESQPAGRGKIGVYFNVRNVDDYSLPGNAGVCLENAMLMELYLNGKIDYHKPYLLLKSENKTNGADAKTKYTYTWEMFIPHSGFATVNKGAFADAFEQKDGKTVLKRGYSYLINAIGAMSPDETFTETDTSKCSSQDDGTENPWRFWYNEGHGDWATDQKYYALGSTGVTNEFTRSTDTYTVKVAEFANAQATGLDLTSVEYDGTIAGTFTVDDGYRLSGVKINGKVFKFAMSETANEYAYSINVADIGMKWNEYELDIEPVVTKLDYTDVTVRLNGYAAGKEKVIPSGTAVKLTNEFGDEYSSTVGENGDVTFTNVLCIGYDIKVDKYIDGEITIAKSGNTDKVTLQYLFAQAIGDRKDLVDLSQMNSENAEITLGANKVNGVNQYTIAAELALDDEIKNGAYLLETTVTVNDPQAAGEWLQRFAIAFAEGDSGNTYKNKFVLWWDDMITEKDPSAIWADDGTTCGGANERAKTFDWLYSSLCDGLKLKVVRNGGYVAVSAFNLDDETWYTLLEGTTSATAANRIAFYVSGESFTFSNIAYEALEVVDLELPTAEKDGKKGHLVAENGDVFSLSGLMTAEDELVISKDAIAYTDYENVEVDNTAKKITITGNGVADRSSHSYNHATYILPESLRTACDTALVFNVKDTLQSTSSGDDWAARRFGVQIGKGAKGFYMWMPTPNADELNVIRFVDGTLDMNTDKSGYDIQKVVWAASLLRSANGLDVQVARIDDQIVINFKNAEGKWVKVGSMQCSTTVENEIKFVGGGDTWEVSGIAAGKLEKTDAVAPAEDNGFVGNVEYYSDGTRYYLADGSVSTLADVTIKQVDVTLSVTAKELDGTTPVTIADGTKIALKGAYQDYEYTVGTPVGKMIAGTYKAFLYGYAEAEVMVGNAGGAVEIALVKTFAYTTVGTHGGESGVTVDGTTVTIKGNGIVDDNKHWAGTAEIVLADALKSSKSVVLTFNLKDTKSPNGGWDWAARRFGVTMQGAKGGFMLFTGDANGATFYVMGDTPGAEKQATPLNEFAAQVRSENGVNMRMVRVDGKVLLFVELNGKWIKVDEYACAADGETKVMLYGEGDDWQFSDIAVTEYAAKAATVAQGTHAEGVTLAIGDTLAVDGSIDGTLTGGSVYLVDVNGKQFSVNGNTFSIAYADYCLGMLDPTVTVTVVKASDIAISDTSNTKISDGNTLTADGSALYDLDGTALNGKEILGYIRFDAQESGNPIDSAKKITTVKGGFADESALADKLRYGDGFGSPIRFKAGNRTNDMCLYLNPNDYGSLTLHVKKGTTQILIYTGTYNRGPNRMTYRLSDDGVVVGDASFDLVDTRAYEVKFTIDTSNWTQESRDLTLYLGGTTECEVAAIVALGGDYVKEYGVKTVANDNVTFDIGAKVSYGANLTGAVTGKNGKTVAYITVNGTRVEVAKDGTFSVAIVDLAPEEDVDELTVEAVVSDTWAQVTKGDLGQNKTIDLTGATLDGKTIMDWNRYKKGASVAKDGAAAWATTGMDNLADGGGDYDDPKGIKIKCDDGNATGEFFCMGGGNHQSRSSVTVKVKKGATQINIYTGSWQGGNNVRFSVKVGDIVLGTQSYVFGNDRRSELVTIAIDTSLWTENEERDVVIEIDPATQGYMLAAIVVLGAAA